VVIPGEFNIKQAYQTIEATFARASHYYEDWRSYQSLWDIDLENIYLKLSTDVSLWNQLLNEMKEARKTISTSEDFKCFGLLQISYGNVYSKVNTKYD